MLRKSSPKPAASFWSITVLSSAMLAFFLNHQDRRRDGREDAKRDGPDTDKDGEGADDEGDDHKGKDDDIGVVQAVSPEVEGFCPPRLSPQQMAILRCLIEGDSKKGIARSYPHPPCLPYCTAAPRQQRKNEPAISPVKHRQIILTPRFDLLREVFCLPSGDTTPCTTHGIN